MIRRKISSTLVCFFTIIASHLCSPPARALSLESQWTEGRAIRLITSARDLENLPKEVSGVRIGHGVSIRELALNSDRIEVVDCTRARLRAEDFKALSQLPHLRALVLNYSKFEKGALEEFKPSTLEFVGLLGCGNVDDLLSKFSECSALREVSLNGSDVSERGLSRLADCATLQAVELEYCQQCGSRGLTALLAKRQLRWLDLSRSKWVSDEDLGLVARQAELRTLGLMGCHGVSDSGILKLGTLSKLEYLDLCVGRPRENPELKVTPHILAAFENLGRLTGLMLPAWPGFGGKELGTLARYCPEIRRLDVAFGWIRTDADVEVLARFKNLEQLSLRCSAARLSKAGFGLLEKCTRLKRLTLGLTNLIQGQLESIKCLRGLTHVVVEDEGVNDDVMKALASLPNLESLELRGRQSYGPTGAKAFSGSKCLTRLALLYDDSLDSETIEALAGITSLQFLAIEGTGASCEGGLSALARLTNLRELRIESTSSCGDGQLFKFKGLEKLAVLRLERTSVTADAVEQFRMAKPSVSLYWYGTPFG